MNAAGAIVTLGLVIATLVAWLALAIEADRHAAHHDEQDGHGPASPRADP